MHTLGKHFQALTREAFARYGFAQGDLLSNWPEIVGEDIARLCEPEQLKWPQGAKDKGRGAQLVVRVLPGTALDVQYQAPKLLERINRFFGYQAVSAIKTHQATAFRGKPQPKRASPPVDTGLLTTLADIGDDGLKTALARLGTNIAHARGGTRSPQPK